MTSRRAQGSLILAALLMFNLMVPALVGFADAPASSSSDVLPEPVEAVVSLDDKALDALADDSNGNSSTDTPVSSEVKNEKDEKTADEEGTVSSDSKESVSSAEAEDKEEPASSEPVKARMAPASVATESAEPATSSESAPATSKSADEPVQTWAQPGPNDFEFSAGTIKKLKQSYVDSLTAEQLSDIRLVIPAEINGVAVTAIASNAFYSYTYPKCVYTELDLSQTTSLQSIGSNAFRYASKLTGDLYLPDTIKSLGESAFADCGFNGSLHLPNNADFKEVPGQCFLKTPFTGSLNLPQSVEVIGRKSFESTYFSGALTFHEGLREVYASAFASCVNLTSVWVSSTVNFTKRDSDSGHHFRDCKNIETIDFAPDSSATALYSEMFGGCTKLKKLVLPDSIKAIDAKAFYNCGLQTVYLPAEAKITANQSSFFFACSSPVAVCPSKSSFEAYKAQFPAAQQKYLSYLITVSFNTGSTAQAPASLNRLFNQSLNRVFNEQTQLWTLDSSFVLPQLTSSSGTGTKTSWFADSSKTVSVSESSLVSADPFTLYAGSAIPVEPTFTYQEIDKVYDGEPAYLVVEGSHPLAKDASEATVGDYAFYHAWVAWDTTQTPAGKIIKQGFDNTLELRDVAESGVGFTKYYTVQSYLYQRTATSWKKVLGSYTQWLSVVISPAQPTVNVTLSPDQVDDATGFPRLQLEAGGTPGTVTWNNGQSLQDGVHEYGWTFTPDAPAVGKVANYQTVEGSFSLRATAGKVVQLVTFNTQEGSSVAPLEVGRGSLLPSVSAPVREGYVFEGWYQDEACTVLWDASKPIVSDMTLYARWAKRAGSVDVGSGGIEINGTVVDESSTVDIHIEPEVVESEQKVLQTVSLPEGTFKETVFFELNLVIDGARLEDASFSKPVPITVTFPAKEHMRYYVAHLKHDGTTELLEAQSDVASGTLSFSVQSLSPFMVVGQNLYQVTFDSQGGTAVSSTDEVAEGTHAAMPAAPSKEGFEFIGWALDGQGTQPWDFAVNTVSENTKLYAQWKVAEKPIDPNPDNPNPDNPNPDKPNPDNPTNPDKPTPDNPNVGTPDDSGGSPQDPPGDTNSNPPASSSGDGALTKLSGTTLQNTWLPLTGDGTAFPVLCLSFVGLMLVALLVHRARRA